ncbi:MAG: HlyD family efflux transporter periplasmic adaptor subunit [Planctomycetota bacterium]
MSPTDFVYPVDQLPSLAATGRRRFSRRFGRLMLVLLVVTPVVLAFAPWQQNLSGEGRVIAFDPVDRPMPVQARTDGLLLHWHVREGQLVAAGDPLVDLADNDPEILQRLQQQVEAAERKVEAARQKREQYQQQILDAEAARDAAVRYADDEVAAAEQDVEVKKQAVAASEQKLRLAKFALEMWEGMVRDRIGSGFDLQKARQEADVAEADLVAKRAEVSGAEAKLRAARSARIRTERSEQVKVQDTRAKRDAADGDIAEAEGSLPKLRRDLQRQQQQRITAPIGGYVQNLVQNGQGGGFVKQGTTLLLLVPNARQLAVELQVDGNDVTFLEVGRHVRLQFEGYPAIQWVGWPSLAVGSFGGTVAFVDRFDDGSGNFRVMVLPDERAFEPEGAVVDWLRGVLTYDERRQDGNPHAWPRDYLRQGVRAKGWIVLDRVSLGFEIWRQLNGFPPSVAPPKKGGTGNSGEGGK